MNAQFLWRRWASRAAAAAVVAIVGVTLVVQDADARRMGGGKSFGRQSPNVTRQATPPSNDAARSAQQQNQSAQPTQPGAQPAQQPQRNRWLGPLAGLAAGLGIAALLSHLGLAGPFAAMLGSFLVLALLGLAGFFIWRMLRGGRVDPAIQRRMEPAYGLAGAGADASRPGSVGAMDQAPGASHAAPATPPAAWGVPADFDVEGFLRNAKLYFIRLQAGWDTQNLDDIREFTTPEVYAEIKLQLDEQKDLRNRTDVVDLDAELLGIEETSDEYIASVRFGGRIREDDHPTPEPFTEVWNLLKPKKGRSGWLLAGIQQLS